MSTTTPITPCGCTQLLSPVTTGPFSICDNAGNAAFTERGMTPMAQGGTMLTVLFATPKDSLDYSFSELDVQNLVDPNPLTIGVEIVNKTMTGFTVQFDSIPDTGNYQLSWNVYVVTVSIS